MTNSPKKQVIGPEPPPPINECRTRLDSTVLGTFSRQSIPAQKQPQQNKKNK